jgi:hypothetical protein
MHTNNQLPGLAAVKQQLLLPARAACVCGSYGFSPQFAGISPFVCSTASLHARTTYDRCFYTTES